MEKMMTNQRNFMLEEAPIHFDNTNADCWVKGADYGYQAAQADQADEIKRLGAGWHEANITALKLHLDNDRLRELVKNLRPNYGAVGSRDIDVSETQRLFDEALSTTQPESVVLDNRTTQKPLSDEAIMYMYWEADQSCINFARAIEERIRTGE
jgi:hypothetical protein